MTLKVYETQPKGYVPEVTAVGCYCLYQERILLLKRSPQSYAGGTWCLPGGKREDGESRIEGAKRELHEECGVELLLENLPHLITLYMEFSGLKYDFSIYHYTFTKEPTLHLNLREHTEARWATHNEALLLPLINDSAEVLEYCLQKQRESLI